MNRKVSRHAASLSGLLMLCAAASPAQAGKFYASFLSKCNIITRPGIFGFPETTDLEWEIDWICGGGFDQPPPGGVPYNIKIAVRAPTNLGPPTEVVLDFGELTGLSVVPSPSVSSEINALHPPQPGMTWYGFLSGELITFGSEGDVEVFTHYGWEDVQEEKGENAFGAAWISDNLDDLGFTDVTDGFTLLGRPVPPLPTVSEWGFAVMVLLLLTGLTVRCRRLRTAPA